MSEPISTTMMVKLAISAVATVASTVMTMQAQKAAGRNAKALGDYNAQLRAQEKEANAAYDRARRKQDARIFRREHGTLENELLAQGASGSGFDDIFLDDIFSFESDQLMKTYQTEVFGVSKTNQANIATFEGSALKQQSDLAATGTAIGGIGKLTDIAITAEGMKSKPLETKGPGK
jgi:hypothetical protein